VLKVNVVIPMAGTGSRFQVEGYTVPKPFIEFDGKMMIEHVLEAFENINVILVIQKKFKSEYAQQLAKLKNVKFAIVPKLTMGAVVTCLAARRLVQKERPVLFADADTIFDKAAIHSFLADAQKRNLDGSILTFKSEESCFSYVKTDGYGFVEYTREKEVISNNAICGAYYFKSFYDFEEAAIDLIVSNDLQRGEFYMSNVYNYYKHKKISTYLIKEDMLHCVGSPKQLNKYLKK
jgi:dTDP-glucose pyrophosphorylase